MPSGGEMVFMGGEKDMFGHAKLGGIGQNVSNKIKELAPQYNGGKKIDMISMNLGYLVRSGAPDAIDCIVPTAYGNLAADRRGRLDQEGRRRRTLLRHGAVPAQVRRARRAAADGAGRLGVSDAGRMTRPSPLGRRT